MAARIHYIKDGYEFEYYISSPTPWPIARIDKDGNKISLSIEEINAWIEEYERTHPKVHEESSDDCTYSPPRWLALIGKLFRAKWSK